MHESKSKTIAVQGPFPAILYEESLDSSKKLLKDKTLASSIRPVALKADSLY